MSKKSTEDFIPLWTPHRRSILPFLELNSQAQQLISNFQDWNGNGRCRVAVLECYGNILYIISDMRRGVEEVVHRKMGWGWAFEDATTRMVILLKSFLCEGSSTSQDVVDRVLNVGTSTSCSRCSIISVMTSNGRVGFGGFIVVFMTA